MMSSLPSLLGQTLEGILDLRLIRGRVFYQNPRGWGRKRERWGEDDRENDREGAGERKRKSRLLGRCYFANF